MYIGAIPTPAATESRQEFTATANQTVFNTTGGTVGFCDCYLNGVKMANSDFSFDGADVTLTTGAAAGDTLAVVMRQADNALVALPIKDSAGNNVLSEANNVVSISSGVQFPAGHPIQTHFFSTTAQPTVVTATFNSFSTPFKTTITNTKSSSSFLILVSMAVLTSSGSTATFRARLNDNTNTAIVGNEGSQGLFGGFFGSGASDVLQINHSELYSPVSHAGGSLEIEVLVKQNLSYTTYLNTAGLSSSLTIMEIAG